MKNRIQLIVLNLPDDRQQTLVLSKQYNYSTGSSGFPVCCFPTATGKFSATSTAVMAHFEQFCQQILEVVPIILRLFSDTYYSQIIPRIICQSLTTSYHEVCNFIYYVRACPGGGGRGSLNSYTYSTIPGYMWGSSFHTAITHISQCYYK